MICIPAISMQNREIINRDQQPMHKDSISEIPRPINSSEEKFYRHFNEKKVLVAHDSVNMEYMQWKFSKQIILGN